MCNCKCVCYAGFEFLDCTDQSTLLSCASVEVMFLLASQQFTENPSACNAGNLSYHYIIW